MLHVALVWRKNSLCQSQSQPSIVTQYEWEFLPHKSMTTIICLMNAYQYHIQRQTNNNTWICICIQSQSTSDIIGNVTAIDIDNIYIHVLLHLQNSYNWILDLQSQVSASTITSADIGATATSGDDEAAMDTTDAETIKSDITIIIFCCIIMDHIMFCCTIDGAHMDLSI